MEKVYIADAFTNIRFTGNPAAVCVLRGTGKDEYGTEWMQKIAAEMNLSETAFVIRNIENNEFLLRWFTPEVEVELCGHATLATSHILWQTGILNENESAIFNTLFSGKLIAKKNNDEITLDFPSIPVINSEPVSDLEKALNVKPVFTGICGKSESSYIVEIDSEEELRNLKPDLKLLSAIPKFGFLVTCKSENKEYDFISRYFAPAKGIDEDPVTGSAHCSLAPYWSKKLNKTELNAYQASKRGGSMKVKIQGDRVLLTGKVITVMEGNLL